jgi:Mrp family chromosome partitioning ATPase
MDDYVKSNYDVHYKGKIDSLKSVLTSQINQSTDKYILDPLAAKESLVQQKINLEVTLDLAKNSIASLQQEIDRLNKKFDGLVPHEAVIQAFESDIDVASKEYLEVLARYNQTSMESGFSIQLKQIEDAQPGTAQPSKKMVLVLMAGMVSLIFYMVVLFILFYLDDTIKVSKELADKTNIPVLGFLPFIKTAIPDMEDLWNNEQDNQILQEYKNLLRSLRFETDREMNGTKSLVVTSMKQGEGKTLFILSLAYAYAKTNKKVLVIDGNSDNPVISKMRTSVFFLEDYFSGSLSAGQLHHESNISLLANRGGDTTLFELNNEPVIRQRLQLLYETFDVVLIETSSLDSLNKSKEWITVTDKVVAVFEVNQGISAAKQVQVDYLKGLGTQFIGWVLNKVVDEKLQKERKKRKGTNAVA